MSHLFGPSSWTRARGLSCAAVHLSPTPSRKKIGFFADGGSVQLIPPTWGLGSKFYADGGSVAFHFLNFMQMGATFPRWGPRFKFFSDGGYGSADGGGGPNCYADGGYGSSFTPRWGLRSKFFADGGYGSADGGDVLNCFADGGYGSLFTPRWGRSSKFFSDGINGSLGGGEFLNCNVIQLVNSFFFHTVRSVNQSRA